MPRVPSRSTGADCRIWSIPQIRLGLEVPARLHFRQNAKSPHQFIWTLPESAVEGVRVEHRGRPRRVHRHQPGGTVGEIVAAGKSAIVHVHISDAKPAPPEDVRDNQRHMPGEGMIHSVGFLQALKTIGTWTASARYLLGRVPAEMPPEEGARLGLETTKAVMKKAGVGFGLRLSASGQARSPHRSPKDRRHEIPVCAAGGSGAIVHVGHGAAAHTASGSAASGESAFGAADARLHSRRAQDARRRSARLSAVPRRLEQAAHEPRRHRRRRAALPVRARAGGRRRAGHLQGRRGLSQHRGSRDARRVSCGAAAAW